jgi:hypothetical protein
MEANTAELTATMEFYCELMAEIKMREHAISLMTKSNGLLAQMVYESCYLQLRMMCELIAISCLVVHGDIPATKTKKMKKTWQADQIMSRLSEIHADFYPRPVKADESDKFKIGDVKAGYLSKRDLVVLYGKCGDRLHRGTIKDVRHRISQQNASFSQIQQWRSKIINLLQHHWIKLHDSEDQIGVQMNSFGQSPMWNYWGRMPLSGESA